MIDVKELRIDNWVNDIRHGYRQVNGIQLHSSGEVFIYLTAEGMEFQHRVNINYINPIPLTPEILIEAGFGEANYTDGEKYFQKDETDYSPSPYNPHNIGSASWKCYRFKKWKGDWYFELHNSNRGHKFAYQEKLNYLHQLQNLYFALTGKEIEIELLTPISP